MVNFCHFSTNFAWLACLEANRIDFPEYMSAVSVPRLVVLSKSPWLLRFFFLLIAPESNLARVSSNSPLCVWLLRHDDRSNLRVTPKMRSHCIVCVPMKGLSRISEMFTFSPEVLL